MARDFLIFENDVEKIYTMLNNARAADKAGKENWYRVQDALEPIRESLTDISKKENLKEIDVDSLYAMYQNVIGLVEEAVKQAPQADVIKKYDSLVKNAYSKDELKESADTYVADFKKPIDIEKLVKPEKPLKYSEDPVQKKKQQAALKLVFWKKYKVRYYNGESEEELNKLYNKYAKTIEDGTDENLIALNKVDASKVELICDIILSKGSNSSLIDFNEYIPSNEPLRKAKLNTKLAFDTFFNPKTSVGAYNFLEKTIESSKQIVEDADKKIHSIDLTVPEGLEDNDVALLTAAEFLSDKVIGETFEKTGELSGSTIIAGTDLVGGGRMAFTVNLLDGDERPNMQYMRYGIADARANAKEVLEQYKSGNRKPMADVLLHSLIQNAKYQKVFMQIDSKGGSFYAKCITDTIKLLDSDQFKDLVEIPQEVRDIDKLNRAHIKMAEEAAELKSQLNDYCLTKVQNGDTQNPKDDPKFVELYSKWYARVSHLNTVNSMALAKRSIGILPKDIEEIGKNRELTVFEKKVIENADEYISLREKFFLDSDTKKRIFEKQYKSWKNVLSNKIQIKDGYEIRPTTFDLSDEECTNKIKCAIKGADDKKYPGLKELLSRAPLDGTKLSRDASKAELDFRIKQYDDFLNHFDSLKLGTIPFSYAKHVLEGPDLRTEIEFKIFQYKKSINAISKSIVDARKFEKSIGAFEKESNALQEQQAAKNAQIKAEPKKKTSEDPITPFADEIIRLSGRINKTHSGSQKNSISYKNLKITLTDCVSKIKKEKTADKLKEVLNDLDKSVDSYLADHANENQGLPTTCGKARKERIKTCARIKTMKSLLDRGIAYDSPEGKKEMLACKLVCAEKLERGFNGFKELCEQGAIKNAIQEKLNDPIFKMIANKALEKSKDYNKLVKMTGSKCLEAYNKVKSNVMNAKGIDKNEAKEKEQAMRQ